MPPESMREATANIGENNGANIGAKSAHGEPTEQRRALLLALGLGLLAAAVRLPVSLRESLWHDECLTRGVALLPWSAWWSGFATTESSPPLYFLLARLCCSLFGEMGGSPPAWLLPLRLPSIVAAAMVPVALFLGTRRRFGTGPALGGGMLLALSPWLIWHGAEARPYALWTLALTGLLVATLDLAAPLPGDRAGDGDLDADSRGSRAAAPRRAAARWSAWAIAAMATHYFAALPVALASLLWGARIWSERRRGTAAANDQSGLGESRPLRDWLIANGVVALACAPLALLLRAQLAGGHTEYIPPAPLKDLGRAFLVVFPFGLDAALASPLRLLGAASMAGLVLAATWRMGSSWLAARPLSVASGEPHPDAPAVDPPRDGAWGNLVALAWLILPTVGLFIVSRLVRPVFLYDRYPIMGLPALGLLASLALREAASGGAAGALRAMSLARRAMGALCVAGLLFCAAWQAIRYAAPERGTLRENWLALPEALRAEGLDVAHEPVWWTPDELVVEAFRHNAAPTMRADARLERTLDRLAPSDGASLDGAPFLARPDSLAAMAEELERRRVEAVVLWRGDGLFAGRFALAE